MYKKALDFFFSVPPRAVASTAATGRRRNHIYMYIYSTHIHTISRPPFYYFFYIFSVALPFFFIVFFHIRPYIFRFIHYIAGRCIYVYVQYMHGGVQIRRFFLFVFVFITISSSYPSRLWPATTAMEWRGGGNNSGKKFTQTKRRAHGYVRDKIFVYLYIRQLHPWPCHTCTYNNGYMSQRPYCAPFIRRQNDPPTHVTHYNNNSRVAERIFLFFQPTMGPDDARPTGNAIKPALVIRRRLSGHGMVRSGVPISGRDEASESNFPYVYSDKYMIIIVNIIIIRKIH